MNKFKTILFLVSMVFAIPACQDQRAVPVEKDRISVQLKWVHQAQFAGFYIAEANGLYRDDNLDVTLVEGGPGIDIIDEVASGRAEFGVVAPDHILKARGKGLPVVAVAVIFRRASTLFFSLKGSGIRKPGDFVGMKAAIKGSDSTILLRLIMVKQGLDYDSVVVTDYARDYSSIISGEADFSSGYATGGLLRLRNRGYEINTIYPDDYGVHTYADTIITSEEVIKARPEVVRRFIRATLKGWELAVENPENAVGKTMTRARDADRALQTQMMIASIPFIHTGVGQIGDMDMNIWRSIHDMLLEEGILEKRQDLKSVFTTRFLHDDSD